MKRNQKSHPSKSCSEISKSSFKTINSSSTQTPAGKTSKHSVRKEWRSLMGLRLPLDGNLWNDRTGLIGLTRKPGFHFGLHSSQSSGSNINDRLVYTAFARHASGVPLPQFLDPEIPEPIKNTKKKKWIPKDIPLVSQEDVDAVGPGELTFDELAAVKASSVPAVQISRGKDTVLRVQVFGKNPDVFTRKEALEDNLDPEKRGMLIHAVVTREEMLKLDEFSARMRRFFCCEPRVNPLNIPSYLNEMPPRTTHDEDYLEDRYTILCTDVPLEHRLKSIEALRTIVGRTLLIFKHIEKCEKIVFQAVKVFQFNPIYFEREFTAEEKKMTEGKTIMGHINWILTYVTGMISRTDLNEDLQHDLKIRLQDVVNASILLWSGTIHVLETFKAVLNRLGGLVTGVIYPFMSKDDNDATVVPEPDEPIEQEIIYDRLLRKYRTKERQRHQAKRDAMYNGSGKRTKRPNYTVFIKLKERIELKDQKWEILTFPQAYEVIPMVVQISRLILIHMEDALLQLSNLDIAIHRPAHKRGDEIPQNVLRADPHTLLAEVIKLEKFLRRLSHFPNNCLNDEEVVELKEVGRIILDRIDACFVELDALKEITHEAVHQIHINYEYCRLILGWKLPIYRKFVNRAHAKYMAMWSHCEGFEAFEAIDTLADVAGLFNSNVHQKLMQTLYYRDVSYDITLGGPKETQPSIAIKADAEAIPNEYHLGQNKPPVIPAPVIPPDIE